MMRKHFAKVFCVLLTLSLLCGCGQNVKNDDEKIELVEPVSSSASYSVAQKRDIVAYKIVNGKVTPSTTEVSFATSQSFEKYGILPGSEAKEGDVIVHASTEKYDKQIENMQEALDNSEEDYNDFVKEINDDIYKKKKEVEYNESIVKNFEKMSESEKKAYGGRGYDAEYADYLGKLASSKAGLERQEQNLKKRSELYNLDRDHSVSELNKVKKQRLDVLATAPKAGKVVAVNFFDVGNWIDKDTSVAAIGDFNNLEVKTEMVYKSDIKRAIEMYAIVNGKKYDVALKELSLEEQAMASKQKEDYSTFILNDPEGNVKAGDYVAIVIITSRKEDALCVPKEAVYTESGTSYVYLYDGDNATYTIVKKGVTSGLYTEILSGVEEGDKVVTEFSIKQPKNTAKISKGRMQSEFSQAGYLWYSKNEWIKNPVESGTSYVDEVCVKRYERVAKGQTIAKIHVVPDDIEIRSMERTLLRANEDLAALIKENEKKKEEDRDEKAIASKEKYITELTEDLNKLKSDSKVTEVVAPTSGIITSLVEFEEGDILQPEGNVAMIAKEDDCFIFVEDAAGQITCGNTAVIEYKDNDNISQTAEGEVVTVAPCSLTESLTTGYSLIRVSPEDLEKMVSVNQGYGGWWMRSSFTAKVSIRVMEDVLLVPKRAVALTDGVTYVTMLDENNNPIYKSFVAGGSDSTNYWVAEGLDEGMVICLD